MSLPLYFTCVARIITSSLSLGILSMKHGRIFPLPPPLLRLQHKPSRGNNKQMREMGTVPSESSQVLWQPSINALVPRLRSRRQAWAWLSQSPSRTGKTWQKSPLPVTFIRTLPATHSRPSTTLETQIEELGVIFTAKHQWGLDVLPRASRVVLRQEHLSDWALVLLERSCAHSWITLESSSSLRLWAQAHSRVICRQTQTIKQPSFVENTPPFQPSLWIIHSLTYASLHRTLHKIPFITFINFRDVWVKKRSPKNKCWLSFHCSLCFILFLHPGKCSHLQIKHRSSSDSGLTAPATCQHC